MIWAGAAKMRQELALVLGPSLGSGVERDPASISGAEMEKNGRGQDKRGVVTTEGF